MNPRWQAPMLFLVAAWIAVILTTTSTTCDAFTVARTVLTRQQQHISAAAFVPTPSIRQVVSLQAAEESEEEKASAAEEEEETSDESSSDEEPAEESDEPEEDPELKALKEQIASLESELKSKRRKYNDIQDKAEEFTKTGYARKVAEMENMRRARSMLASSNRSSATAGVLAEFLPVYDELMALQTKYETDDFGKQYQALPGAMSSAMKEMGVADYELEVGMAVDKSRMVVVDSEHNEDAEADTVLQVLTKGMELQGNVIRMAECVASLGPEPKEEEEEATEEEAEEPPKAELGE